MIAPTHIADAQVLGAIILAFMICVPSAWWIVKAVNTIDPEEGGDEG